jgi:hypothetical protein
MDGAELDLFERGLRHATATHTGAALDAALDDLGWHDALRADLRPAVSILFESQGAANATSSALDDILSCALQLEAAPGSAVVLPASDRWQPPGDLNGDLLSVRGLGTARLGDSDTVVVVAGAAGGVTVAEVKTADLVVRPVHGIDRWLGLVEVTGVARDVAPPRQLPPDAWPAAVGLAQLAIGHELVGAAGAMLDLARTHALERFQFGQPIGAFQAIRHRLADTLVAIEAARAVLAEAWEDGALQSNAMAKAMAGRGARTAARHCQQVLAGMGFTTEHPLHRYLRRVLVLDELFGSARSLTRMLGRDLIASRQLPTPLAL